jgi:hypothetical protein
MSPYAYASFAADEVLAFAAPVTVALATAASQGHAALANTASVAAAQLRCQMGRNSAPMAVVQEVLQTMTLSFYGLCFFWHCFAAASMALAASCEHK